VGADLSGSPVGSTVLIRGTDNRFNALGGFVAADLAIAQHEH
jgi:hypothetical protein